MGKGKRKGKGPSVLPPFACRRPRLSPGGRVAMDAERPPWPGCDAGVLLPPRRPPSSPFSIPPPPWLAGALLAGRIPPCGLFQSFPPPLHPHGVVVPDGATGRVAERLVLILRRRRSPYPLFLLPLVLRLAGAAPRWTPSVRRPPLLRLCCRGLRPPLSQLPRPHLLPRWRPPLSPSFFSLPWTKPNFQAAPDGSEASPASARLAPPASQGPEAPSWPAVAAS
ncbi:hornerin-like [Iris pallida]|uniref:Hornerin-like n=1 Tax=Iris pallida TaxID=29817 RepID=A0AAX6HF95_IRIPA|nr:hornerin-like [Iris pallida]